MVLRRTTSSVYVRNHNFDVEVTAQVLSMNCILGIINTKLL